MLDFDALVLGPCQAAFGDSAILTPVRSNPGGPAYAIRGIYALMPQDETGPDGLIVRMDGYTFSVRTNELPQPVARGDLVSDIALPFMVGRTFLIEDLGDDGFGAQKWVLKEARRAPTPTVVTVVP